MGYPKAPFLLLFILLYIDNICYTSDKLNLILFADDTTFSMAYKNLSTLVDEVNVKLVEVQAWLKLHRLVLNTSKSNMMIFT